MSIERTALMIATIAHEAVEQKRKYTGHDYITHPIGVAKIVERYTHDEHAIAAALLHDVIEDTGVTEETLFAMLCHHHAEFDARQVMQIVMGVTKVSTPMDGVRKVRRAIDHVHFAGGDWRVQLVKAADSLHNVSTIGDADDQFRARYVTEKRELAGMLTLAPKELLQELLDELDKQEKA